MALDVRRGATCADLAEAARVLGRHEDARRFLERYGWERQGEELVAMYQTLVENRFE